MTTDRISSASDLAARIAAMAETHFLDCPLEYAHIIDDPRPAKYGDVVICGLCSTIVWEDVEATDTLDQHARAITSHLTDCPQMQKALSPALTNATPMYTLPEVETSLGEAAEAIHDEWVRATYGEDTDPDEVDDDEFHMDDDTANAISDMIRKTLSTLRQPALEHATENDFRAWLDRRPSGAHGVQDAIEHFARTPVATVTAWWQQHMANRPPVSEIVRLHRLAGHVHSRLGPALLESIDAGYTLTEIAHAYRLPAKNLASLLRDHLTSMRDGIPASYSEKIPELRATHTGT